MIMSTELLYDCPVCGRKNYTLKGLKAHVCKSKGKRRMTPTGPLEHQRLNAKEIEQAVAKATRAKPAPDPLRKGPHTIRVRWSNGTHQAIDDRSWVKCSNTGGHEQAAFRLLEKQGIEGMRLQLQRLTQREQGLRDPKRAVHEQWRLYKVVGRCRECGCTDDDCSGCIERTGQPCSWLEEDLCSACG